MEILSALSPCFSIISAGRPKTFGIFLVISLNNIIIFDQKSMKKIGACGGLTERALIIAFKVSTVLDTVSIVMSLPAAGAKKK